MVVNKRIAVMADTVVNEKKIASHSAIITYSRIIAVFYAFYLI